MLSHSLWGTTPMVTPGLLSPFSTFPHPPRPALRVPRSRAPAHTRSLSYPCCTEWAMPAMSSSRPLYLPVCAGVNLLPVFGKPLCVVQIGGAHLVSLPTLRRGGKLRARTSTHQMVSFLTCSSKCQFSRDNGQSGEMIPLEEFQTQ